MCVWTPLWSRNEFGHNQGSHCYDKKVNLNDIYLEKIILALNLLVANNHEIRTAEIDKKGKKLLTNMLEKARMPEFPKNSLKEFEVEGKKKFYTSYLHFFESVEIVNDSEQKIGFKCK